MEEEGVRKLTGISTNSGGNHVDDGFHTTLSTDASSSYSSKSTNHPPHTILTIQCDWETKINHKEEEHHPPIPTTTTPLPPQSLNITFSHFQTHPRSHEEKHNTTTPHHSEISTSAGKNIRLQLPKANPTKPHANGCLIGEKCSFKVELIDETILIQSPSVARTGDLKKKKKNKKKKNDFSKKEEEEEKKLEKGGGEGGEVGMRRRKNCRRRGGGGEKGKGVGFSSGKSMENGRVVYSRKEMELLRYKNFVEQRKIWDGIHLALGPVDGKAYDELEMKSKQHQQQQQQQRQKCIRSISGPLPPLLSQNS